MPLYKSAWSLLFLLISLTIAIDAALVDTVQSPSEDCTDAMCSFDDDVCDWSLEDESIGWHWSSFDQPDLKPPFITGDEYIWTQESAVEVRSPVLTGVTDDTTFSFSYYFMRTSDMTASVAFNGVELGDLPEMHPSPGIISFSCNVVKCCSGAPSCSGQFSVATHDQPGESVMLAINDFNTDCGAVATTTLPISTTTPAPTTTAFVPPEEWCCTFDESHLCYWSPHTISTGWLWSNYTKPIQYVPEADSYYIFVEYDTADAYSKTLPGITTGTTFTVTYYFHAGKYNEFNRLALVFQNSAGLASTLNDSLAPTDDGWRNETVTCDDNCCKYAEYTCEGVFRIVTYNSPQVDLVAAIDDFFVNDDDCVSFVDTPKRREASSKNAA